MEREQNTFYTDKATAKEMRREAVELELRYPSEFIAYLWEFYKKNKGKE